MKAKSRRPAATDLTIRNDILRALLSSEYQHLRPRLEQVDLEFGDVVYGTDQRIDHVYFPETAVVAMIDTLDDGSTVEVLPAWEWLTNPAIVGQSHKPSRKK